MIGAGDMSVARVVGAVADKGRLIEDGWRRRLPAFCS
jgi:hypothetical protein